ncbi:MAG: DUF3052 domain-containing protein [Gemmatimonadota bacterium]
MAAPGYSGKPLVDKLGFRAGMTVSVIDAPRGYRGWLGELPPGSRIARDLPPVPEVVHIFATSRKVLAKVLGDLRPVLPDTGFVWVSWPKRTAGVETDITEDVIREVALPMGFVDVKVCAVTDVWSGLKLVIRRSERRGPVTGRRDR